MRYTEIKQALKEAEIIDEVSMSPSSLEKFANSPEAEGMLIGIEWEMCVPNAADEDSGEGEYDYDQDERAYDISGIIEFFRNGEMSNLGSSAAQRLSSEMWDEFSEWQSEQISNNMDTDELEDRVRDRMLENIDVSDYEDEAREELGKKANDDEVYARQKELARAAVDEMMNDRSGDYDNARDDIREEMEEEMREDGDYDEQSWLSDIGVDSMSDAERQWSLDWPHWTYSGGGEVDVNTIADEFADGTGFTAKGYSGYHSASRTEQQRDGYFIIEPDASIDADEGDGGLEFISPPMPLKDGLEMIKKVKAWASSYGCYTNKSTGLHMNISVPNMTIENLDYVKLALFLGDEHVLKEFDRTYNNYAKSAMKVVREKIQQNPENATALLAKMKEHLNAAASKLVHSGITQKYTSINTKDKYVEFRGPGGDYLDQDIPKLLNTALRAAQALRIATDDGAYKQEYAKKLYKLVSPNEGDWTDPNNSVALFSRYALGQINKTELVNNVRQAQVARKEKKGEEQQYWVLNKDGSGGKQMVFATSSTEAIIKGGKQMGMSREDSISRLKAEPFVDTTKDNTTPASVPINWLDWIADTLPTVTVDTINSVRQRMVNHQQDSNADNLDADAKHWIVKQLDRELRARQDQGVVDGNETRWRVILSATTGGRNYEAVYVDADTPRQAKLKAVEIFRRDQNITVGVEDLDAIAVSAEEGQPDQEWTIINGLGEVVDTVNARTSEEALRRYGSAYNVDTRYYRATSASAAPTTSREVFDSLPNVWQDWLQDIRNKTDGDLQRIIDTMARNHNLELGQKEFIINTVRQEQQRRTGNNATAQAAGSAENAVRDSLPEAHRDWIANVADHSDMGLINVLRNVAVSELLSDQQAAYFRVQIKHELRRRGINPDTNTEPVQQQGELNFEPAVAQQDEQWNVGNHTYGREIIRAPNREEAIRLFAHNNRISVDDVTSGPSFIANQLTDSAADRVGPGQARYSVEHIPSGQVTQVIANDAADAIQRAATATRGMPSNFRIARTNESIDRIRQLAGLK